MRYCFSITADQVDRIDDLTEIEDAGFEIRLDRFENLPNLKALRARTGASLLATFRTIPHWGNASLQARETVGWPARLACLDAGFDLIDLELDEEELEAKIRRIQRAGARAVVSHHGEDPSDRLDDRLAIALASGADLVKIIGVGSGSEDFAHQRARYQRAAGRPLLHFYMGAEHAASRVLSLLYGAPFTFVTPSQEDAVAPGQLTHDLLARLYRPLETKPGRLKLFAVIGAPIGHSQSPAYHNPPLKTVDSDCLFLGLPASSEGDLALLMRTFPELRGLAVTKPMKGAAFASAAKFSDARIAGLGAVNTLLADGSTWTGANTDFGALMELLRPLDRSRVLRVLGYGGLGRAAVCAGLSLGFPTQVCNRTASNLNGLDPSAEVVPWERRHEEGAAILLQATSAGMVPHPDDSPLDYLPDSTELLIETIYNPERTRLMGLAAEKSVRVVDGMTLFREQARLQSELFRSTLVTRESRDRS